MQTKTIYAVNQTQCYEEYEYKDKTIHLCSTMEEAQRRARLLNREYGEGCEFSEDGDYIDTTDWDCFHYYDVEAFQVDEPLPFEEHFDNK